MKPNIITFQKMGSIFCDYHLVPKGYIENYYLLVVKLMGTYQIQEKSIIFEELDKCIDELDRREKQFLILKFGLDDKNQKTLKTIAEKYNITTERVRQVISRALRILFNNKSKYFFALRMENLKNQIKHISQQIEYYEKLIKDTKAIEKTIYDFDFSTRAYNCLSKHGIVTYEQLMELTPIKIINIKNLGEKTANEIWLKLHGERFPFWLTS